MGCFNTNSPNGRQQPRQQTVNPLRQAATLLSRGRLGVSSSGKEINCEAHWNRCGGSRKVGVQEGEGVYRIAQVLTLFADLLTGVLDLLFSGEEDQDVSRGFAGVDLHHCPDARLQVVPLRFLGVEDLHRVQPPWNLRCINFASDQLTDRGAFPDLRFPWGTRPIFSPTGLCPVLRRKHHHPQLSNAYCPGIQ